ncbi:SpoIID/LytB domain-containing protein [Anaerobacillus sp. CMMVII]|uniref:SpoIID/LytB domain-containing protein n=1 Tax=Anaerobacillus sp. CMMVII TaxID=2755588 RepID=UPI0021B71D7B|nr:SpoIID/LytB domain-containing protein [Anaerobacillus sp. CMMVII]MCT8140319.1 SpoIID/LytB domain-containing protein [Anaerobacillus sp. CMMVII]
MKQKLFIKFIIIALVVLLVVPANGILASGQNVSVKLSNFLGDQTDIEVRVNGTYIIKEDNFQLTENKTYRFRIEGTSIAIFDGGQRVASYNHSFTANPAAYSQTNFITINNRRYLGEMRFAIESNVIRPMNTLPLEDYLKGVVPHEMLASWGNNGGMEALKAQAVTARTYALKRANTVMTDTQNHQVYGGFHWQTTTSNAVDATTGEVARHNGVLIDTFYSSSNGGKILSNRNVWGTTKLAYLDTKDDPYDLKTASLGNQRINWNFAIQKEQISLANRDLENPALWWNDVREADQAIMDTVKNWLAARGLVGSQFESKIVEVPQVRFTTEYQGTNVLTGSVTLNYILKSKTSNSFVMENNSIKVHTITINDRHDIIRSMFGSNRMWSPYVKQVEETNTLFRIHGGGWGHNIGMSQYGAYQMSREGLNYRDIISFYYSGAQVVGTTTTSPTPTPVPTPAPAPEPVAHVETFYVTQTTDLYNTPSTQSRASSINPQNVTTIRRLGDWYEINTWLGPKWINPTGILTGGARAVNQSILLTKTTQLFHSPLDTNHRSSVGPQTVTATHQWNDWYRINTWLGAMWIKPEGAFNGQPEAFAGRIYVLENTNIFSSPTATTRSGSITPQNVTTLRKWGEWYEINTWLGPQWIKPNSALMGGIDRVSETIQLTKVTQIFDTPLANTHRSSLGAQTITSTHKWNDWYLVNTWLGPKWIKPTGVVEVASLNVRRGPGTSHAAITQLSRGTTVTVLGLENGWYKIKHDSFNGEGYVSGEFLKVN